MIEERTKDFDCELKVSASNMDMGALGGSGIQVIINGEDLDELKNAKPIEGEVKEENTSTTKKNEANKEQETTSKKNNEKPKRNKRTR